MKKSGGMLAMLALLLMMTAGGGPGAPSQASAQDAGGTYENLGTSLKRVVATGGVPFRDAAGKPYISGTVNGSPAQFVVVDALTLEVVKVLDIPDTTSVVALVAGNDGNVYIGTTGKGQLYRYVPGAERLELVGKPIASETHIYDLTNGPDGKIYGGTYPRGKIFEFDTAKGTFRDMGTPVAGEKYVRQLAYDPERRLLIAGTGTSNKLVEISLENGEVSPNWMPESLSTEEYPNSIDVIGEKLFIQLNKSSTLLVMDKRSKQIEYKRTATYQVIPSPGGAKAYFFAPGDATLHAYDLAAKQSSPVVRLGAYNGWKSPVILQTGTSEAPEYTLSAWMGYSAALTYNMTTGKIRGVPVDVPGQPIEIRSIAGGPDGRVYTSGIQGGNGVFDPATGKMEMRTSGMSQAEGVTSIGNVMYFGIYPQARVSVFDTRQPWGSGNPKEITKLPADSLQDRPFAMLGVKEHNKLFIGTVPQYGQLGGAFAVYDPASGALQTYRNLVEKQSIITLAYKDGKVYGGTSIWGAYGAPSPTTAEGKLFVWDIASGQKELELTPVQGKQAVTSLIVGPDGNIWGFDEGVLFIFDPAARKVTEQKEIMPVRYTGTVWSDAYMLVGKDGNVYGTARGVFFRVHGKTKQVTVLDESRKFGSLTQDASGDLYMRSGLEGKTHELWRYSNPDLAFASLQDKIEAFGANGSLQQPLYMQLRNTVEQAAHQWRNGKPEQAGSLMEKALEQLEKGSEWAGEAVRTVIASGGSKLIRLLAEYKQ